MNKINILASIQNLNSVLHTSTNWPFKVCIHLTTNYVWYPVEWFQREHSENYCVKILLIIYNSSNQHNKQNCRWTLNVIVKLWLWFSSYYILSDKPKKTVWIRRSIQWWFIYKMRIKWWQCIYTNWIALLGHRKQWISNYHKSVFPVFVGIIIN